MHAKLSRTSYKTVHYKVSQNTIINHKVVNGHVLFTLTKYFDKHKTCKRFKKNCHVTEPVITLIRTSTEIIVSYSNKLENLTLSFSPSFLVSLLDDKFVLKDEPKDA